MVGFGLFRRVMEIMGAFGVSPFSRPFVSCPPRSITGNRLSSALFEVVAVGVLCGRKY